MYNMKMVVRMLGIPAVTIRAWETRYAAVEPSRTEGGHRLYSDQDMEDLRWLKQQVAVRGLSISHAVQFLKNRKRETANPLNLPSTGGGPALAEIAERLYAELVDFNSGQAHAMLEKAFAAYPYEDIFHGVLAPILYRVGDEWENGRISVAHEHYISHFVAQWFFHYYRLLPTLPALPRMIAYCPEGEHHQLGLLLFVLFLRKKGFDVLYLGANTPIEGVYALVQEETITHVCLSLSDPRLAPQTLAVVERLKRRFPDLNVVLGGRGFDQVEETFLQWRLAGDRAEWERWYEEQTAMAEFYQKRSPRGEEER